MTTVENLFIIEYGQSLELSRLKQTDDSIGVNFVSRTGVNNGVSARVVVPEGVSPSPAGTITVALGGSVLSSFVQPEPFVCGRDVAVLTPRDAEMSLTEKLWWAVCIRANAYRFAYGRQANRTLRALQLPDEVPSWVSEATPESVLEKHDAEAKSLFNYLDIQQFLPDSLVPSTTSDDPEIMTVGDLFTVTYGQSLELNRLRKVDAKEGVNFVSRTAKNNGVSARVAVPDKVNPSPAGVLTVALGGSVLSTFYQPEPFVCGRDVAVLTPKREMTVGELLWWSMCIRANAYRFAYGRQANRTLASLRVPSEIPEYAINVIDTARTRQ